MSVWVVGSFIPIPGVDLNATNALKYEKCRSYDVSDLLFLRRHIVSRSLQLPILPILPLDPPLQRNSTTTDILGLQET